MKDDILETVFQLGPMDVYHIAEWIEADVYDVSTAVVDLIDDGLIYLEPTDGTLWYAGAPE